MKYLDRYICCIGCPVYKYCGITVSSERLCNSYKAKSMKKKVIKQKRYQYWGKNGLTWSEWFNYDGPEEPYQFGKKLKNEYRII